MRRTDQIGLKFENLLFHNCRCYNITPKLTQFTNRKIAGEKTRDTPVRVQKKTIIRVIARAICMPELYYNFLAVHIYSLHLRENPANTRGINSGTNAFACPGQKADVSQVCLGCLCEAVSGCNTTVGCSGDVCGPFRMTRSYWTDGGKPTLEGESDSDDAGRSWFFSLKNDLSQWISQLVWSEFGMKI